jgi:hypothetical protein
MEKDECRMFRVLKLKENLLSLQALRKAGLLDLIT